MQKRIMQLVGTLALVWVSLSAPNVLGQAGTGPHPGMRNYDPSTEVTVKGTVSEVQQQAGKQGWQGTHLVLKTDAGELRVHVGPSSYIASQGFAFAKGDNVEVTGSKVKFGEQEAVLAREIKKDGKVLTLRDAQGIPKWSRGGRGAN